MIERSKSLIAAGLVVALSGCGGDGGGGVIITPPADRTYPSFSIGTTGQVQTVFLSGASRRATISQVAAIRTIRYQNSSSDYVPTTDGDLSKEIRILLDGYTLNTSSFSVPLGSAHSMAFQEYPLVINRMYQRNADNSLSPLTSANSFAYTPPQPFDSLVRIFPGRVSSVTVRLNDAICNYSSTTNSVVFNTDLFISSNYDPIQHAMTSSFSDYVSFDLSAMDPSNRPTVSNSSAADRVYFSGDGLAMSSGLGDTSVFDLIKPIAIQNGKVSVGPVIGPSGQQVSGSNLYILDDTDPSNTAVTSIVGTWRQSTDAINPGGSTVGVAFPSSRETDDPADMEEQQFVIYSVNGFGQITAMWEGAAFYNTAGDPTKGTFRMFPINTIDDALPGSDQVTGTVSNLVISGGVVLKGDWDVTSAMPASWTFGTKGGFAVYRR